MRSRRRPGTLRPAAPLAAMSNALRLLPDFLLIVVGWFVCRHTPLKCRLVTVSTLVCMVSVPFWLAVSASLR